MKAQLQSQDQSQRFRMIQRDVRACAPLVGRQTSSPERREVSSAIRKENTFLLKFFVPEVSVNVIANGAGVDTVPINLRGDMSIAWDDYSGTLKLVAK